MALPTRVPRTPGYDPLDFVSREFGNVVNRLFNARDLYENGGGTMLAPYAVDVREDADHIFVEAELPGFTKDQVDITLENSTLTITAERKHENTEGDGGEFLLKERRYTRFARSFTLPPTVDDSKVDAKLTDGVLRITLNKREETKPRKINVG